MFVVYTEGLLEIEILKQEPYTLFTQNKDLKRYLGTTYLQKLKTILFGCFLISFYSNSFKTM